MGELLASLRYAAFHPSVLGLRVRLTLVALDDRAADRFDAVGLGAGLGRSARVVSTISTRT